MTNTSLFFFATVCGLLLALNPVSISIFTALLAVTLGKGHKRTQLYIVALTYLSTLWILFAFGSTILFAWLSSMNVSTLEFIGLCVSVIAIAWGLIGVKDYYWYGQRTKAPAYITRNLHMRTVKNNSPANAAALALIAAYATAPSMGIPLLSFITINALIKPFETAPTLWFATVLLSPLFVVLLLAARGTKLSAVIKWKQDSKAIFRLCIGLSTIVFGWVILLILNGSIGAIL